MADFELWDQDEDKSISCNKNAAWGDADMFPLFSIIMIDENNSPVDALNYLNTDPSRWKTDEFNRYYAIFTVTEELAAAK